jgi:hypothetical protein
MFKDKTLHQSRMFTALMESMAALVPGQADQVLPDQGPQEADHPEKLQEVALSTTLLVLVQPRVLPAAKLVQEQQDQAEPEARGLAL